MNKKQKQDLQNKEFCKKFLKTDWDGCAANEYFALKCEANPTDKYYGKPKNDFFDILRDMSIAENKVYSSIANLAFEKNRIVGYLVAINRDGINVPENINNKEKFIKFYLETCNEILEKINKEQYDFQNPKLSKL